MLKAKNDEQKKKINFLMDNARCHALETCVNVAGEFISYDEMAAIVDYLRGNVDERRRKARMAAINSRINKLWVSGNTVFLIGVGQRAAEQFIQSLEEYGYDTQKLMDEYSKRGIITI